MLWNDVIWNDMMLYTLLGKRLSYSLSFHFCVCVVCVCVWCACVCGGGWGEGSNTVVTFNLWAGPLIFSRAITGDV